MCHYHESKRAALLIQIIDRRRYYYLQPAVFHELRNGLTKKFDSMKDCSRSLPVLRSIELQGAEDLLHIIKLASFKTDSSFS